MSSHKLGAAETRCGEAQQNSGRGCQIYRWSGDSGTPAQSDRSPVENFCGGLRRECEACHQVACRLSRLEAAGVLDADLECVSGETGLHFAHANRVAHLAGGIVDVAPVQFPRKQIVLATIAARESSLSTCAMVDCSVLASAVRSTAVDTYSSGIRKAMVEAESHARGREAADSYDAPAPVLSHNRKHSPRTANLPASPSKGR